MTALSEHENKIDLPDQLASLLVKVSQDVLLLPNVSVAEIVNLGDITNVDGKPDWYLGAIDWRNLELPLISYEGMSGQANPKLNSSVRVIILNGIKGNALLPFYGLVSLGIPRLSRVSPREIDKEEIDSEDLNLVSLRLSGESVTIPNLENIEQKILDIL